MGERGTGFKIESAGYTYYLRCRPGQANYDVYLFAYDNRYLLPELAGQHEIPGRCYSILPSTGELISLTQYENGYAPCDASKQNPEENRFFADTSNKFFGITRAQEEAMLAGSLFGWDKPAAQPWNYDENGNYRLDDPNIKPKNKDKER